MWSNAEQASMITWITPRKEARPKHRALGRQSKTTEILEAPVINTARDADILYNEVWAGATYHDEPNTFTFVSGIFTIPNVTTTASGALRVAVGIDGVTCSRAVLQSGIDIIVVNGTTSYLAWNQWYPDPMNVFNISLSPNNRVRLSVLSSTVRAGSATIENLSTGQSVTQPTNSTTALCQQDAAWVVERAAESKANFTDFGTLTFSNALAASASKGMIGPDGASLLDIKQDGHRFTTSVINPPGLAVQYNPK